MRKNGFNFLLREEQQIADADRQTTSVGPGSNDNPFYSLDITKANPETPMGNTTAPKVLPFQIELVVQQVGDLYIKMCELRQKFVDAANNNPSLEPFQQSILNKVIKNKIDKANKIIISIPEELNNLFD